MACDPETLHVLWTKNFEVTEVTVLFPFLSGIESVVYKELSANPPTS